jgi:ribosomal protein S14
LRKINCAEISRQCAVAHLSAMIKLDSRCANCGGKLGLVSHQHWGLRFCRKSCMDDFLAKTARDHARMRKWFGLLPRGK